MIEESLGQLAFACITLVLLQLCSMFCYGIGWLTLYQTCTMWELTWKLVASAYSGSEIDSVKPILAKQTVGKPFTNGGQYVGFSHVSRLNQEVS